MTKSAKPRRWLLPWLVAAAASITIAVAGVAAADAIRPPPSNCVRGAHGRSSHEGPRCEPNRTCTNPDDPLAALGDGPSPCNQSGHDGSTSCEPIGLCLVHRSGTAGGRFPNGVTPPRIEFDEVVGACGAHDHCPSGAHCNRTTRCVPPSRRSPTRGHLGS